MLGPTWKGALLIGAAASIAACSSNSAEERVDSTSSAMNGGNGGGHGHGGHDDDDCDDDDHHHGGGGGGGGHDDDDKRVGLSLWFDNGEVRLQNGTPATIDLYENYKRYVHELDITAQAFTTTDEGIEPLKAAGGDMADLDWRGVQQVDEDWRPEAMSNPPTFTRSRFYRNAKWMKRSSSFKIQPIDAAGRNVGDAITENAGSDDDLRSSDDGFIRRFDARTVTPGCRAIGDCSNATGHTAQALMQVRIALHAKDRAERIPKTATKLKVTWSEQPGHPRYVAIRHRKYNETPYRYGFKVQVDTITEPANGKYFVPGEGIDFRVTFKDGSGNRLHPQGQLYSYVEFATDQIASGLRFYDGLRQLLTLYYAMKHREGLMIWNFEGPTNKLKYSDHAVPDIDFVSLPQIPMATVPENGFSALFNMIPPAPHLIFTPEVPAPDTVHVDVPADALPGTYLMNIKGRRDWGGESTNEMGTAEVKVGQRQPTTFVPKTGRCNNCHENETGFDKILHGTDDRRTCYGCHAPLSSEPDHALDYRIHLIHTRSKRVEANPNNCSMCHLTPPSGPPRGFPGIGPH